MQCYYDENALECGVDEAGRGPLIGRIYAGCCIWPLDLHTDLIKDSKKYKNIEDREKAYDYVIDNCIAYGSAYIEATDIDKIGIQKANMLVLHKAIQSMNINPSHIIVDGTNFKPFCDNDELYPQFTTIVEGDNKFYSIAAASIIAKVEHDRYIKNLINDNPELKIYGLETNMGYGTKEHMDAIKKFGISKFHRKSFKCCGGSALI